MAADEKWYFTKEQLANTPSRKCGIDADKELSYRQQAANFIQDMGQRLVVSQLCINTAIVYMHRFYVFHSLSQFHRNSIAAAALFLAAKVEEQPRKLEHVIKVAHMCLHRDTPALDTKSEQYLEQAQDLVFNENVLLQTLGFDVAIDHPHTHVVRCCHLVKASKDLAQTSYFMASNSLHLTTMCLQYKPTVVACFCIHLACKWSNWEIPQSNEGKYWFWYVDKSVTSELLGQLTGEFLHIFDKCPSRLKRKIRSISANQSPNMSHPTLSNSPFDAEPRKVQSPANADGGLCFQSNRPFHPDKSETDNTKKSSSSLSGRTSVDYREYREKKERERIEREKAVVNASSVVLSVDPSKHHSHHHKQSSSGANLPNKHSSSSSSSSSSMKQTIHHNHHHSSRQDIKSSSQLITQRHSTVTNQPRDPNRDRQRMSREYNSSGNTSGGTVYSHSHPLDNCLDPTLNNIGQDSLTVHPAEKLSNNVHKSSTHDSRANDPRHSKQQQQQQQQQQQKDVTKPYTKYADSMSTSSRTSRKPDILEQRSEEVRKLIEKPLPPPKPRAEVLKEEYAAMMLKQSHHPSKYGHQPEKSNVNSTQTAALPMTESKMLNVGQTAFSVEKSPNAPVSASQISHKSLSASSKTSQMLPLKNGSSSSSAASLGLLNNLDDAKAEKRPRGQPQHLTERASSPALQTPPAPTKHRSLFSPEKIPAPSSRESSHSQRSKQKQKTSPALSKHDLLPSFTNPTTVQLASDTLQMKQRLSNNTSSASLSSQKQHRGTSNIDVILEQDSKQHLLEGQSRRLGSTFSIHEPAIMVGARISDLTHTVKDNSVNSKGVTPSLDVKTTSEHIKAFDSMDSMILSTSNQRHKQQHHGLSNGLDTGIAKQEYSTIDTSSFLVKLEPPEELLSSEIPTDLMFMKQEQPKLSDYLSYQEPVTKTELTDESELVSIKQESYSPLKSVQSISALLQEPLAPMPSLLQQAPSYEQQQQSIVEEKSLLQLPQQLQIHSDLTLPSTVDMSELVGPIQCTVDVPTSVTSAVITASTSVTVVPPEDKKLEHRSKSEKKKKEKKHKHKDKDKSKDKHKHKHKDKDKEKHHRDKTDREKDNKTEEGNGSSSGNVSLGTVPIKITIPKDKLNLSSESIGTSTSTMTSSSNSSLKIKIPKERLKGTEVSSHQQQQQMQQQATPQQAPLKIKIRTDALSRSASELQVPSQLDGNSSSRKRERVDAMDSSSGAPPAKKQQQQRQNGRHNSYNSGSNDKPDRFYDAVEVKTDSGEAVEELPKKFVPTSYGSSPKFYS